MRADTQRRVEAVWCELLGASPSALFHGVSVDAHTGLGDYLGIVVVARNGGVHVSAPPELVELVGSRAREARPASLMTAAWWRETMGRAYDVLGPAVHHYLDHDRCLPVAEPERAAVSTDPALLDDLRGAVPPEEWAEGGFADRPGTVFVAVADGRPVAAANLTEFGPWLADVGVVTDPAHRCHGLGRTVAAAATASSLAANGLARWRAREENLPSLRLAARLGFEPWCRQLAVKPR